MLRCLPGCEEGMPIRNDNYCHTNLYQAREKKLWNIFFLAPRGGGGGS